MNFLTPLLEPASASRYILRNERTGEAIATRIETAFDSATRRKGLLGRTGLDVEDALIIAPCNAVHTFFMKFTIDVAFVNRHGIVVRACHRVRPWGLAIGLRALAAIELREGTLERSRTQKGDRLLLEPSQENQ
jgi:uncharacterized membrane protein (UPF0127 family)